MKLFPRMIALSLALAPCFLPLPAHAFGWPNNNDSIFPPQAAAKPYVNFDGKGFIINGKRTYIVSGELQYPRTPRAMWRDRLLRIKRAGYNTVQTYAFWNYHEPREGEFEFTGEKDFDAFLKLVHSLNMYAIVRMGPYVNAEWDTGGLPVWLRFKPGLNPMSDNAQFYKAVTPYLDKLFPILAANQINHGGPIIMVQLENEHVLDGGAGGGTDMPNAYYHWYYDKARKMGMQIPLFFSGLNHSDDPAGDSPFDISSRTSPWYSTEFWTGWVGRYGMDPDRAKKLERTTWKVIAYGGAGYTHYTMAGGTDFDTWNNDQQAASYDFGSPIGQVGDLRDAYYRCKRAAMFATSFAPVLSNSLSASGGDGTNVTQGGVQITNRKGAAGEVLFLDNSNGGPTKTQIRAADGKAYPSAGQLTLEQGEIMPVVKGFPLAPGLNLELAAAHVLGISKTGVLTTLIAYGAPGDAAELHFSAQDAKIVQQPVGQKALSVAPGHITLQAKITDGAPALSIFQVGKQVVRVLTMSADMADRTWFLDGGLIACGPDYIGETEGTGNSLRLMTERRSLDARSAHPLPQLLYSPAVGQPTPLSAVALPGAKPAPASAPTIGPWRMSEATAAAQPGYNDVDWKSSRQPLPMGADGDFSAYAWYRVKVNAPRAGVYQINISDAGDWLTCFVNGKHADSTDVQTRYQNPVPRNLNVTLKAGQNSLAFLTAHYGRNKLFNYYGLLDTIDAKGISGTVSLTTSSAPQTVSVSNFRWQADDHAPDDAAKFASPDLTTTGGDWHDATTATDAFNGRSGWAWFRATLPSVPGQHRRIHFNSIDDNGTVYLNGKKIADNVGVNAGIDISLDSAWRENGPNVLAVAVQNTAGAGGLLGDIKLTGGLVDGVEVHGWKMRGGLIPPTATSPVWQPLSGNNSPKVPAFYHTTFNVVLPNAVGPHPILRAGFAGLSRGFFYLNGRCLGRYPEKAPIDSIYLPESLLLPGKNNLVVFDEDGNSPQQVKLIVETNASRYGTVLAPRK